MATLDSVICYNYTWLDGPYYWFPAKDFDCCRLDLCYCPVVQADPDVAGIGVIVSFMVSAALTLMLTIPCVILGGEEDPDSFNPWDNLLAKYVYRPIRQWIGETRATNWSKCLQAVVLTLSDSQLVTGIAMLVSAILLMNEGTMVVYHFNTVTNLAWLSANTHLLSLLAIRAIMYRDPEVGRTHSITHEDVLKYVRVCLMLLLAALLLYCSYISGYRYWADQAGCPVLCIKEHLREFPKDLGGVPLKWLIVNDVLILSGYPFAVGFAFTRPVDWLRQRFKPLFDQLVDRHRWSFLRWLANWFLCGVVTFWLSDLEAILEGITWFALGMYWTIGDRNSIRNELFDFNGMPVMPPGEWDTLESFGFGQLVPLFLLLLPVMAFIESWKGKEPETPASTPTKTS